MVTEAIGCVSTHPRLKFDLDVMTATQPDGSVPSAAATVELLRQVIALEARSLEKLIDQIDETVALVVDEVRKCTGHVIVAGVGKSGLIGRKIAATFCSTGTPALFLHPVEAFHGDFGIVQSGDLFLALSASGETSELLQCIAWVKRLGVTTVCVTCQPASSMAQACDFAVDLGVRSEADSRGLAPMSSTTAMLALGDALAAAVADQRGFTAEQFARLHPGGAIGRRLLLRVGELMHGGEELPLVAESATLRDCVCVMSRKRLGVAFVVDGSNRLAGILTDGDLRRLLERIDNPLGLLVGEVMTRSPTTTTADRLATEALHQMETRAITVLPVLDAARLPIGAIHLHDLVKAGLA